MKTMVYHTGALGDFITVLPAIKWYKDKNPSNEITFFGRKSHGELGVAAGYFNDIWDCDRSSYSSMFSSSLSDELQNKLAGFGAAIAFTDDNSPLLANLKQAGVLKVFHQPPFPSNQIHIVDYHLSIFGELESIGVLQRTPHLMLKNIQSTNPAAFSLLQSTPIVAIHPGSGSKRKNWPIGRFKELSARLKAIGFDTLWILGPAETDDMVVSENRVARNIPLIELAALLKKCSLYIGNDSGVSHLASALQSKSIVLFGPSNPVVWRPLGDSVRIVDAQPQCRPCHPELFQKPCDENCMERVLVDEVFGISKEMVGIR